MANCLQWSAMPAEYNGQGDFAAAAWRRQLWLAVTSQCWIMSCSIAGLITDWSDLQEPKFGVLGSWEQAQGRSVPRVASLQAIPLVSRTLFILRRHYNLKYSGWGMKQRKKYPPLVPYCVNIANQGEQAARCGGWRRLCRRWAPPVDQAGRDGFGDAVVPVCGSTSLTGGWSRAAAPETSCAQLVLGSGVRSLFLGTV